MRAGGETTARPRQTRGLFHERCRSPRSNAWKSKTKTASRRIRAWLGPSTSLGQGAPIDDHHLGYESDPGDSGRAAASPSGVRVASAVRTIRPRSDLR